MSTLALARAGRLLAGSRSLVSRSYSLKSFEEIPGPRGLPLIGLSLDLIRDSKNLSKIVHKRVLDYGTIYKEKMFPGYDKLVVITDPKDIETVFRADGKYPDRPDVADLFGELRKQLKLNDPPSLFISQGEDWYRQRQPMSQFMSVPRRVGEYYKQFNEITQDLLQHLERIKDPGTNMVSNLLPILKIWSFECEFPFVKVHFMFFCMIAVVCFTLGKRLYALNESVSFPEGQEFVAMNDKLNENFLKLIFYPPFILRNFPNKYWKELLKSQQRIYDIAKGWIEEKQQEIDVFVKNEEMPELPDFLTYMLLSGKMSIREITLNSLDLLMAGIETTSTTLAWCLYHLATSPESQDKLCSEVQKVVSRDEPITPEHIHNIKYLNYCLKESLRMVSVASATLRRLSQDVELSGYKVPAGSLVLILLIESAKSPELFPENTNKFVPERWNREEGAKIDKFAHVPFGFGPRMCVGRRVAELELYIALADIMRNYKIEFTDDKPMNQVTGAVETMEREFNLKFHKL